MIRAGFAAFVWCCGAALPVFADDALKAEYEAELSRIHAAGPLTLDVSAFETLFTLYCMSGSGSAPECACAWDALAEAAVTPEVAYLASRSEGDDVLTYVPREKLYPAIDGLGAYYDVRARCD